MSSTWNSKRKISPKLKDLAFGFIRDVQRLLPMAQSYYIIPNDIKYICAFYYGMEDKWDKKYISDSFVIQGDILEKIHHVSHSAYLSNTINNGRHHWKFILIEYNEKTCTMSFGIFKNEIFEKRELKYNEKYAGKVPNTAYVFNVGAYNNLNKHDHILNGFSMLSTTKYGKVCETNDVIDMYLDLDKLTLSYSINDEDFGIAHRIDKCEYRACVNMFRNGDKIKLISYEMY